MEKSLKIIISLLIVVSLLCVFSGCGETNDPTPSSDVTPKASPTEAPDATATPEATAAPEKTPAPTKEVEEIRPASKEPPQYDVPEADADGYINLSPFFDLYETNARCEECVISSDIEKAFSLFDGTAERIMRVPGLTSANFIFVSLVPIKADSITLSSGNDASSLPVKFTLYGCKNNLFEDLVVLYSTDDLVIPTEDYTESDKLDTINSDYFQCFRLSVESVNGGNDIVLGELTMYAKAENASDCIGEFPKYNSDISNYTVLNSHIKPRMIIQDPAHDGSLPKTMFDNDIETCDGMTLQWAKEYSYISYTFVADSDINIDAYRFTIANVQGAPKSWKLYGSDDKSIKEENLVLLDERNNEAVPLWKYGESDVYTIQNPGTFKYYVIYFTDCAMIGNDENWMTIEIAEMTLLQKK